MSVKTWSTKKEQLDCFNSKNADGLVSNTFHLNQVDKKELYWTFVYFGLFAYIKSRLLPSGAS